MNKHGKIYLWSLIAALAVTGAAISLLVSFLIKNFPFEF